MGLWPGFLKEKGGGGGFLGLGRINNIQSNIKTEQFVVW